MNKSLVPIVLLSFVNVLGFSILIPVLPFIVDLYQVNRIWFGILLSLYAFFQFIGAPILGGLSDSLGRKPMLILSHAGTLASWLIFAFAYFLPNVPIASATLPILVIAFSRALDGITGGNNSIVSAYVTDVTKPKDRAQTFGIMGAVFGFGFIVGPALGGWAAGTAWGYLGTITLAAIISLTTLIAIVVFLPESHKPTKNKASITQMVLERLRIVSVIKKYKHNKELFGALLVRSIFAIVMAGYTSIISLYLIDAFGLDETQLGNFLFFVGFYLIINQLLIVKPIVNKIGEIKTLILGIVAASIGLILISQARTIFFFGLLYYVLSFGISLIFPTIKGIISNYGSKKEQGVLQGIDESIMSLAQAVLPIISTGIYLFLGNMIFIFYSFVFILGSLAIGAYLNVLRNDA